MSADVVNLRQARKRRERAQDRAASDARAAKHGEDKASRLAREAEAERLARALDGSRRGDGDGSAG